VAFFGADAGSFAALGGQGLGVAGIEVAPALSANPPLPQMSMRSSVRGLPPVDAPRPSSTTNPSSSNRRTTLDTVAWVSPVAAASSTRLMVRDARITSRIIVRLFVDGFGAGATTTQYKWCPDDPTHPGPDD